MPHDPAPEHASDHDHPDADADAVLEANGAFYAAFEARDLDAMSDLWMHDDQVTCVHPGWITLRGWGAVAASWAALFGGPQHLQFIVTDLNVVVTGDLARVTCDENLLGDDGGATVAVINLYARAPDGSWRMVAHHGSPVMGRALAADDAGRDGS